MSTASSMVRPEQVHHLADSVNQASQKIVSELATLDSAVAKLRDRWSGEAQEAYNTAHRAWNTKIDELNGLLGRVGVATGEIGSGYTQGDQKSAGRFS